MKIIHQNGYSREELQAYRSVIHKNLIDSMQALIMAMRKLGVDPEDPANRINADRILEIKTDADTISSLPSEAFRQVEAIWHDPVIPGLMDRASEFYLMDSATYFFSEIRKLAAPDYVPDEADVLRARSKTTGISETRFNMGQLSIHMFDVGGQRSERKKWIH
ncbi:Guanine nucleotide-binding protein alpha-2 subunit, partial [Cryptotrichosporon argae]